MKTNINLGLIVILFALNSHLFAADTIKIDLTYKYKLDAKGQPLSFVTTRQKMLTPDNIVFREVNYDENSGQMSGYIFYFYRNNKLYTREFYNSKDSLLYILKYDYDNKGNESAITKLEINKDKSEITEKTVKIYDTDSRILSLKKYFGKKAGVSSKYKYNAAGLLLNEKIINKPIANGTFKSELREYSYSSDNKIEKIKISRKELSGVTDIIIEEYSYNEKGLLSSVKQLNHDGKLEKELVYNYLELGFPSSYEEHDAQGKKTLFIVYDYKKHYMEKGTQISRYENF